MSKRLEGAPDFVMALPAAARSIIAQECEGDWARVVRSANGGALILNNAPKQAPPPTPVVRPKTADLDRRDFAIIKLRPAGPPKKRRRRPSPESAPPPRHPSTSNPAAQVRRAEPARLSVPASLPTAPVTLVPAPVFTPPPVPEPEPEDLWILIPGLGEPGTDDRWARVDPTTAASRLLEICRAGLPEEAPLVIHRWVQELEGVDLALVQGTVRLPHRVEIDSQTKSKRYPVLDFFRGDYRVVVGFQNPASPTVVHASSGARLQSDRHRVNYSGGGGARKKAGLPTTATSSAARLRELGAVIPDSWTWNGKTVEVRYNGELLGEMQVGRYTKRDVIQSDYQRFVRKIDAIKQRKGAQRGA